MPDDSTARRPSSPRTSTSSSSRTRSTTRSRRGASSASCSWPGRAAQRHSSLLTKADACPDLEAAWPRRRRRRSALRCWHSACAPAAGIDELRARLGRLDSRALGRSGARQEHARERPRRRRMSPRPPRCGATARAGTRRPTASCTCLAGGGVLIDTPGPAGRLPARRRAWRPSARSATSRSSPRAAASPTAAMPGSPAAPSRARSRGRALAGALRGLAASRARPDRLRAARRCCGAERASGAATARSTARCVPRARRGGSDAGSRELRVDRRRSATD